MKRLLLAALLSVGAWAAAPADAQVGAEGTVRGVVRDEQGGILPGVTVTARSPTVAKATVAVSDGDGGYRLINLAPGDYTLSAELAGFSKTVLADVQVRAGLNLTVDFTLAVGALSETVQVARETPMLETQKPIQGINVSGEMLRALPLTSRHDYSDFLETTPGVTSRGFDQATGGQVYMLRGSDIENHVTQIDGADVGSFRQGWASLYTGLSTDAVSDVQVKTGGADASSPLGVGLIINIATESGTNALRGAASAVYTARGWNGRNTPTGTSAVYDLFQPDLSIGGPILKDRLFFYGAYRYSRRNTGIARTESQLATLHALDPAFEPFDNEARNQYVYVKGTAQLTPNHQMYAFYQRDENPEDASAAQENRRFAASAFGGQAVGTRLTSAWGKSITTRLLAAYNNKSLNGSASAWDGRIIDAPSRRVFDRAFLSAGVMTGAGQLATLDNPETYNVDPTSKVTLSADLTWFTSGRLGSHEIQTGVYLKPRLRIERLTAYPNGGFALEDVALREPGDPAAGTYPFHRRVYDVPQTTTTFLSAKDYAVYLQDAWRPTDRLTISAGLRLDWIAVDDRLYSVETQRSLEVGPRTGATYVLTSDQKNVVRASYGRIADLPQWLYLPTAGTDAAGFTDFYDNDGDGVFELPLRTNPSTGAARNQIIDPDRHQPFVDEFIVGYRRQLPGQMSVDASWVRRYYKDRPALVDTNGIFEDGVFKGYRNPDLNSINLVTNNEWNTMVYSGLELTVAKQTKQLQIIGGYTRGWQHLDGTWQPNDPASFIQPDAFPNDRGLGSVRGNLTDSLSGNADIRSPSWQKHGFRIGGSYRALWDFVFASSVTVLSGPYSGPVVTRIASADPRFGPPIVTLPNGRQVSNPLATTIRFAYADRGEGQINAPNLAYWNLRVGRDFRFGARRLDLALDLFNVTNRGEDQQFLAGGNQTYSANYAIGPDGEFRGTSRQFARQGQISVRYRF